MKHRKKIRLHYAKERVVFSDVLPYELPLIFSNRYFYRFLVKNGICVKPHKDGYKLCWNKDIDEGALCILAMLMQCGYSEILEQTEKKASFKTIPFSYSILHKPTKNRRLALIHPLNQIKVVDFYDRYRDAIIYLCSKSNFSMRHPQKVASYFFYKDRLHHILLGRKTDKMEMFFSEYENLKTYFSYKEYTNIYKFYEDYRYQRAEKKFQYLLRTDVQSCFDSIYTHSIAWAINGGADIYKDNFAGSSDGSIGVVWDKMMQEMTYNETNGIVIGPEFSRLFAEVILQHIDQRVEYGLLEKGFKNKVHYECYRYVDDYFFFFNDEKVKDETLQLLQDNLKEYKLSLSGEKTKVYPRPFVTDITRAKIRIDELISEYIRFYKESGEINEEAEQEDEPDVIEEEDCIAKIDRKKAEACIARRPYFKMNAKTFNKKFKAMLKDNGIEAKDVLNYTIARLSLRLEKSLKSFDEIYKGLALTTEDASLEDLHADAAKRKLAMEKNLARYLHEVVDATFFLYSDSKRINTTLKVLQVLNTCIIYLDNNYEIRHGKKKQEVKRFTEYVRDIVFKRIFDEISLVFKTAPINERIQLETLYFLIVLRSMNRKYHLASDELIKYLNIHKKDDGSLKFPHLNAIAIIILLYYMGNESKYTYIKSELLKYVEAYYAEVPDKRRCIMSEYAILTLDLAACPLISDVEKKKYLKAMKLYNDELDKVIAYLKKQKYMFTKWTGVNITKELNAKISQEVYS